MVEQEVKVITEGLKDEEKKKKSKDFEKKAIQRIKVGLVLNEFGEANKIKIEENEIQAEIQKTVKNDAWSRKIFDGVLSKKSFCSC